MKEVEEADRGLGHANTVDTFRLAGKAGAAACVAVVVKEVG